MVPGTPLSPQFQPVLLPYECVWQSECDLRRSIAIRLAAQATDDRDGMEWKFFPPDRHHSSAATAGDSESPAFHRIAKATSGIPQKTSN